MKKILALLICGACLMVGVAWARPVAILHDEAIPQAAYAARKLGEALVQRGYDVERKPARNSLRITLTAEARALGPEAFAITPEGNTIVVRGGDLRGVIYGALALAEQVRNEVPLE